MGMAGAFLNGDSSPKALDITIGHVSGSIYDPNGIITVTNTFAYSGSLYTLYWRPVLPPGWVVASAACPNGTVEVRNGEILFEGNLPASPITMTYQVSVPFSAFGACDVRAQVGYWILGMDDLVEAPASPDPLVVTARDTDGDGLPDAYEQYYTGSPTGMSATDDSDNDGMNNLAECRAGTDPMNKESVLKIDSLTLLPDASSRLVWRSVSNRYYTVQSSTNLVLGFLPLPGATNILGSPPTNSYTATPDGSPMRFYRIQTE